MARRSRRWLCTPVVLAALVAAASSAGAQVDSAPAPAVAVWAASCVGPGPTDLVVYGRGWAPGAVELKVDQAGGSPVNVANGVFQARISVTAPPEGSFKLTATQGERSAEHTVSISGSCAPTVAVAATGPACAAAGEVIPIDLNVSGVPQATDLVVQHVDLFGPAEAINRAQPARSLGFYAISIPVKNVPGRVVPVSVEALQADGSFRFATASVRLPPPCSGPGATTAAPVTTAVPTFQPIGPLTTRPVLGGPAPLTPSVTQPRPARPAGAPSLSLSPSLGQSGQAVTVAGRGFAPSTQVTLRWRPGIGEWAVRAGSDGSFRTQVLVLPNDVEGGRMLDAVGEVTASSSYLVVPASKQSAFGGVFLRG